VVEDRPGPGEAPARRGGMRHPGTDHPDALATSIAASWPTISPVLLDLDLLACWHRPSRSHHGSQAGCPRLGWDSETLTGVLLATVPDPAIGPRRQTQPRPPAANDTMAVGGQPDPFSRHHSVPQGDTSTQAKIPARGGKLAGTYQGRPGPCPLRGAVTVQRPSRAPHLHPQGWPPAMSHLSAIEG
jgi:hypothetical protein